MGGYIFFLGQRTFQGHEREREERKNPTVAKSLRTTIHVLANRNAATHWSW